jgi:hypothetical protein
LLVDCELSASVGETRAVLGQLRCVTNGSASKRGTGFDDIKVLMGEWLKSAVGRLRREAVNFRLDARTITGYSMSF